jgi:hypothetical protein
LNSFIGMSSILYLFLYPKPVFISIYIFEMESGVNIVFDRKPWICSRKVKINDFWISLSKLYDIGFLLFIQMFKLFRGLVV